MARTTYLNLELLEAGDITLADLINIVNANSELISNHDHGTGRGREIALSSVIPDSDLNMNSQALLNVDTISMLSKTAPSTLNNSLYFKNGCLLYTSPSPRD